ncbi:MAG: hypothetical protein JRM97_09430 [Nitrososphaerota archaeon]|nr:hypothetical protein [Nitrososphaerota archaeon]
MIVDEISTMKNVPRPSQALHPASQYELPVTVANAPAQGSGVVSYTFTNPGPTPAACVLYRGVSGLAPAYYFGNAFGPGVYAGLINGQHAATYYSSQSLEAPTPSSPDGVYSMAQLHTAGTESLTCFVFIVPARGTLLAYEGGIPDASLVNDLHAYVVDLGSPQEFCITYSPEAVAQYELQTGYSVSPPPNPYTTTTVLMSAKEEVPANQVFPGQYGTPGRCEAHGGFPCYSQLQAVVSDLYALGSSGSGSGSDSGEQNLLPDVVSLLECLIEQGYLPVADVLRAVADAEERKLARRLGF